MLNPDNKPFHMRESQHLRLRRPRNLLKSQKTISYNRYQNQTKMAPPSKNQNPSYE
jgi:hypothetical protein